MFSKPGAEIAELPVTARIGLVRGAWQRERDARLRYLRGDNQKKKLAEADAMLAQLEKIEEWCRAHADKQTEKKENLTNG